MQYIQITLNLHILRQQLYLSSLMSLDSEMFEVLYEGFGLADADSDANRHKVTYKYFSNIYTLLEIFKHYRRLN